MDRANKIYTVTATIITSVILYLIFDSSKASYSINIIGLTCVFVPFIYRTFHQINFKQLKNKSPKKALFIGAFCAILFLPMIQQMTGFVNLGVIETDFNEKRKAAECPEFEWDSILNYPGKFNSFYNDNFGYRKLFISANNYLKINYLSFPTSHPNVVVGKKDWLFYNASGSLANYKGSVFYTDKELQEIKSNLVDQETYLSQKGIKFYLAILPDKMSVYPQYMDEKYKAAEYNRTDQLIGYLQGIGMNIIDTRATLRAQSEKALLYQKNDSHWNKNGAIVCAEQIVNRIKIDFPNLPTPKTKSDYVVSQRQKKGGDLSNLLGLTAFTKNEQFIYEPKDKNTMKKKREVPAEYKFYDQSYQQTFLYEQSGNLPTILVFNDSFVSYIHSFLGDSFSESSFFWTHDFRKDVIEIEKPNIVLHMIVERSLIHLGTNKPYDSIPY